MKKFIFLIYILACFCFQLAFAASIETGISKEQYLSGNRVIDKETGLPVVGALVTIPQSKYKTYSNKDGYFTLNTESKSAVMVVVEKDGYRNFSTTLLPSNNKFPMSLALSKDVVSDIILENSLCHLGDGNFSPNSANSSEFKTNSVGPFYSKTFKVAAEATLKMNYLVIGSVIGIDTLMAKQMGQNKIANSYSTPPEVYFNGQKIAEIQLNGDNQRIKIPSNLIRGDMLNEVTIKTGHNLLQPNHMDYDDIEFINLSIQTE